MKISQARIALRRLQELYGDVDLVLENGDPLKLFTAEDHFKKPVCVANHETLHILSGIENPDSEGIASAGATERDIPKADDLLQRGSGYAKNSSRVGKHTPVRIAHR